MCFLDYSIQILGVHGEIIFRTKRSFASQNMTSTAESHIYVYQFEHAMASAPVMVRHVEATVIWNSHCFSGLH